MLLTLTNLYPRPDQPRRGMYNAQLYAAMHAALDGELQTVCLVPEWRPWRWMRRAFHDGASPPAPKNTTEYATHHRIAVDYVTVPYLPWIGRAIAHRLVAAGCRRRIGTRLMQADAVFASWLYPDGVAAARLARRNHKPYGLMALGSDTFHLRSIIRRRAIVEACNHSTGVVCVWRGLADRLLAAGVKRDKLHVVPNGADTDCFHYRPAEDAVRELPPDVTRPPAPLILWVGNLVKIKGPELMIDAFARVVRDTRRKPILLMLGAGPMRRHLESRAERLGLANRVLLLGNRPHREVAYWMNIADCLCLTSRSEGMPNVVIEALVSGLPVAAANVGAVGDMLAQEPDASVVAPRNPAAMAHAVHDLLADSHDRKAMAARNAPRFSWKRQAERILQIMKNGST